MLLQAVDPAHAPSWMAVALASAVVASLVSGLMTTAGQLIGQGLERRGRQREQDRERQARQRELALRLASEAARNRTQLLVTLATEAAKSGEEMPRGVRLVDEAVATLTYFEWFESQLRTGDRHPDARTLPHEVVRLPPPGFGESRGGKE